MLIQKFLGKMKICFTVTFIRHHSNFRSSYCLCAAAVHGSAFYSVYFTGRSCKKHGGVNVKPLSLSDISLTGAEQDLSQKVSDISGVV